MDIYSHVILIDQRGLAGVKSDSNLHARACCPGFPSQSVLGFYGCRDSIGRPGKNRKERITMRADSVPVPCCEDLTQNALMLFQHLNIGLSQVLRQLCGSSNITEKHV